MKLAIMQPYFFPYIGYFQLMNAVDEFVLYDNIEFTKKGWINRNRILANGRDTYITLPLKRDSDFRDIAERHLADIWPQERKKMLNRIIESYRKAPYFKSAFPAIEESILIDDENLFQFLFRILILIKTYLGITTPFVVSTSIEIDHSLRSEEKVIAICTARKAEIYFNPIGGLDLYSKNQFKHNGIGLFFLKSNNIQYPQFTNEFVPFLSIIDVMMFNSKDCIREFLSQYTIQ